MSTVPSTAVMAGLVPAIHAFFGAAGVRVDARDKRGHDGRWVVSRRVSSHAARKARDYAEADRIRAKLEAMGIALKDAKDPATGELVMTWEVKR